MRAKKEIIVEVQRIAKLLGANRVSQNDFEKHGTISVSGVTYVFGSWNRAVKAAGLEVYEPSDREKKITDKELMEEVIRLTRQLGKEPSEHEMGGLGKFSPRPYVARWGTFAKARTAAYEKLGYPGDGKMGKEKRGRGAPARSRRRVANERVVRGKT